MEGSPHTLIPFNHNSLNSILSVRNIFGSVSLRLPIWLVAKLSDLPPEFPESKHTPSERVSLNIFQNYQICLTSSPKSAGLQLETDSQSLSQRCLLSQPFILMGGERIKDFDFKMNNINNVWHVQTFIRTRSLVYIILFEKVNMCLLLSKNM